MTRSVRRAAVLALLAPALLAPVLLAPVLLAPVLAAPVPASPGASGAGAGGSAGARALEWRPCPGERSMSCATLVVPRDHADPSGPTLGLAVRRLPARRPDRRIGSLVVNPGGPGGSGVNFLRRASGAFGTRLRDRFDLVSWDPRGVGDSAPVRCTRTPAALEEYLAADPDPDTAAERTAVVGEATAFAAGCLSVTGAPLLGRIGTEATARDLDLLRAALGDRGLTYLGFSYGTLIGAVYADLFPRNVRAMVLDGALDPSLSLPGRLRAQAAGFQEAFGLWVADCTRTASCARQVGSDPGGLLQALLDDLERRPLAVDGRPLTEAGALAAVLSALYSPRSGWPRLAPALAAARRGDGRALLEMADGYNGRQADGSYSNLVEANIAISCADETLAGGEAAVEGLADELDRVSPLFGRLVAWSAITCARWPLAASDPAFVRPRRAAGAPPIVVVGTRRDPATPLVFAQGLADQLARGVLVEVDGTGHTAYLGGGTCVRRAVEDHLLGLGTPRDGLRCGS
jgi:pimeloyl-ACP methyl ester carboxylesterase